MRHPKGDFLNEKNIRTISRFRVHCARMMAEQKKGKKKKPADEKKVTTMLKKEDKGTTSHEGKVKKKKKSKAKKNITGSIKRKASTLAASMPNKKKPEPVAGKSKKARVGIRKSKSDTLQSSANGLEDQVHTDALLQNFFNNMAAGQPPANPEPESPQKAAQRKSPTKELNKDEENLDQPSDVSDGDLDDDNSEPAETVDEKTLELLAAARAAGTPKARWKSRHLRQVYVNQLPYTATQNTIRNFFREVIPKDASDFIKVNMVLQDTYS